MKEIVAIAFSDLHLNEWKNFSKNHSRLRNGVDVIRILSKKAHDLNVPLLFAGDLIHNPASVSNRVLQSFEAAYKQYIAHNKVNFVAIDGNHDQNERNTFETKTRGYIECFSINKKYIKCVNHKIYTDKNSVIAGIPYLTHNEGFIKAKNQLEKLIRADKSLKKLKKILLIHTDLPGAKTPDGLELEEYAEIGTNLDEQFKNWDLVLSGHIHLPQRCGSKVYMLGSPQHQTTSDAGTDMGYWEVYSDMTLKLIPLKQYPQFIYYDAGDKPKDNINFWIERPEPEKEEEIIEVFNAKTSRSKLAKRYCKATGQYKKKKIKYLAKILNSVE